MIRIILVAVAALLVAAPAAAKPAEGKWAIAIHGGAGVIERKDLTPEQERAYRAALTAAVEKGSDILRRGGSSLDAVEAVIRDLEDDPLFNAGRGAVFTAEGRNELDASIMDGRTLAAGSVAGVTTVRHPISLARAVMERSPHVMMVGQGAEAFARSIGLEIVEPGFFFTERRWQSLGKELARRGWPMPPRPAGAPPPPTAALPDREIDDHRFGTVGVAAMDQSGALAAGTSTGGTTAKRWGRVGDAPIIGAGTYADSRCAVSATGTGEFFIRMTVARDICALVQYRGMSLQRAADEVVVRRLTAMPHGTGPADPQPEGGVIGVSRKGELMFSMNTPGMYRGGAAWNRPARVAIFRDER